MIPAQFIEELKYRSEIESVVSRYVNLKKQGRGFVGLCPFHSEKTPSFHVNANDQYFYCFGCGAGGDVVTFIRRIENLDYVEAVRFLAQQAGMALPEDSDGGEAAKLRARLLEANRTAARLFHEALIAPSGEKAMRYLSGRGLDERMIRRFGIGYAPDSWDMLTNALTARGFTREELETAYLSAKSKKNTYYDRFRDRIMFPIIDVRGNVIAFGGRAMGDVRPKYLNTSDTPVFKKSRNLFALNFAKNTKRASLILTEGYMDAIALYRAGLDNAVATLGTALTPEQARLIARHVPEALIAYDSDEAGRNATRRATGLLEEAGLKVRVLRIPDAKDPDEYITKFGAQRFGLLIDGAMNAAEDEIEQLKSKFDLTAPDGRLGFLNEFARLASNMQNPVEREIYISGAAQSAGVSVQSLTQQVQSLIERRRRGEAKKQRRELKVSPSLDPNAKPAEQRMLSASAKAQEMLIVSLIRNPGLYEEISQKLTGEDFDAPMNRNLYLAVCERLATGEAADLIFLSSVLEPEAMGRLSGLMEGAAGIPVTRAQALDCIATIQRRKSEITADEIRSMDDEDLRGYISSLAPKKK